MENCLCHPLRSFTGVNNSNSGAQNVEPNALLIVPVRMVVSQATKTHLEEYFFLSKFSGEGKYEDFMHKCNVA